jgi:hypothetical protein
VPDDVSAKSGTFSLPGIAGMNQVQLRMLG